MGFAATVTTVLGTYPTCPPSLTCPTSRIRLSPNWMLAGKELTLYLQFRDNTEI